MKDPLGPGTIVEARGERWTVLARVAHADCESVTLSGISPANVSTRRTLLTPFDRVRPLPAAPQPRVISKRAWAARALERIAGAVPFGGTTAAETRVDVLPFQLEPALAVLRHGATRVLIADDVGLGKTVQAGLVLHALSAQSDAFRALALMPAGLRDQWRQELTDRFGLDAILADALWLAGRGRDVPPEVNPWSLPGIYLASVDLVKRPEVLRALEDVTWDLVIVDEAHNCALGTARLAAARAVAARARRVLLLTATPPDGDAPQLSALHGLGALDEPLIEFRRTRADVTAAPRRRSTLLPVRLSAAERRMHRLLDRYSALVWREASGRSDTRARLAVTILRKRALSSAWSLERSVRRRHALLGTTLPPADQQLALPFGDEDVVDDDVPDAVMGAAGLSDGERELSLLDEIGQAAGAAAGAESKVRFLLRLLRRLHEPIIVFTEYRDTLTRLEGRLAEAGISPLLLHGGLPARERAAVQQAFNRHGGVLLATDAASEGLNLHTGCRAVLHFELPWTPARLEQRTGRVDRLGQTRTVHELLLVARHTAERLVLAPLVRRAQHARERAGGRALLAALTESRVAASLMEGRPPEADGPPSSSACTVDLRDEAAAEAVRVERIRAAAAVKAPAPRADAIWVCAQRGPQAATLLFEARLVDALGRTVHAMLVPVRVAVTALPRRAQDLRDAANRLASTHGPLWDIVETSAAPALARAREQHAAVTTALAGREAAMQRATPSAAKALVQIGLFDGRGRRLLEQRREAATLLAEEADERRGALATGSAVTQRMRLAAVRFGR